MYFCVEKNLTRSFLPRLEDVKKNSNKYSENETYITKKRIEFQVLYDISLEKRINDLELPEYILGSPTKKAKNDDDELEIPDIDEVPEEHKETDVDLDDPDWDFSEGEDEEDEQEFEIPKSKRRCTMNYPRATAAGIRFGISPRALCILIWAILMGKKLELSLIYLFS